MRKRVSLWLVVGLVGALAPAFVATSAAGANNDSHCTDHTTEVKVEDDDSPATVEVVDTRTGDLVEVVVTINGPDFTIEPTDSSIVLEDADWCIKSSTNINDGNGTEGTSTSTNKRGKVQDISYVVIYSVTTEDANPPQPCNQSTQSGGAGVTVTAHELGVAGPTSFLFEWEAYSVPDQFEVLYEGVVIYDTGVVGDSLPGGEGTGSDTVNVPAGTDTSIEVRVTGPDFTAWDYRVNCPAAP